MKRFLAETAVQVVVFEVVWRATEKATERLFARLR